MRVVPASRFHRHCEIALLDGHLSWHGHGVFPYGGWEGEKKNTMEKPWKFIVYHGLSSCLINHVLPHVMAKKRWDLMISRQTHVGKMFTWKNLWSVKKNSGIFGLWNPEPDHKTPPKWIGNELLEKHCHLSQGASAQNSLVFLPFSCRFPDKPLKFWWHMMTRLQVLINTREYPCHIHIPINTINGAIWSGEASDGILMDIYILSAL
jgi:hypothetical protein